MHFAYEWHDDSGQWFRSYGNENGEFNEHGFMQRRIASINDLPIDESERKFYWPAGRRPDDHPGLSDLDLSGLNNYEIIDMKLQIFCVGGTIDKIYFDAKSKYQIGKPAITQILKTIDVGFDYQISSLMGKDSLEMTDDDRALIAEAVADSDCDKILITHGTDTMTNTAAALQTIADKTILLTGALSPAIFKNSDAEFNIGCALGALQSQQQGVYIAMNGSIFKADKVIKDVENNRFIAQE